MLKISQVHSEASDVLLSLYRRVLHFSIPKEVIGMATCEDKSRGVPRSHSEWSVVIGSRRMARSAGI
jgi:hypothetical protein